MVSGVLLAGFQLFENGWAAVPLSHLIRLATSAIFGLIAVVLLLVDSSKASKHLVACFLLVAVSYSMSTIQIIILDTGPMVIAYFNSLIVSSIEAFLAYQAWAYFGSYFLQPPKWIFHSVKFMKMLSLSIGILLVAVNVFPDASDHQFLLQFMRHSDVSRFHLWAYVSLLPFFPGVVAMYFFTSAVELKKVAVLILGIGFTLPALLIILAFGIDSEFQNFVRLPIPSAFFISGINLVLMLSPLTIAYASIVFGRQGYDGNVSNIVLYRISLVLVNSFMIVPAIGVTWYFYSLRESQLNALFQDARAYLLMFCFGGLLGLYTNRSKLTREIALLFHRRTYNIDAAYSEISEAANSVENVPQLFSRVIAIIDTTLQPSKLSAYVHDPYQKVLNSTEGAEDSIMLDEAHHLALKSASGVLFESGRTVLVIKNTAGELFSCIIFGNRKNEDMYDLEDRRFLLKVQSILSAVFSKIILDANNPAHDFLIPFEAARECSICKSLYTPQQETCPSCESKLTLASIPYLLNQKYHLVSKLGMGEFGQVYLGTDNSLARKVAIKCLPDSASNIDQEFLKKEALLMAQVSHPNLAIVYGIEFWHGRPLLVVEYLPGGTLEEKLKDDNKVINASSVIKNLCKAVEYTHKEGVLHLDIKPSNIGFSKQKDIKLLDFGTAHLVKSIMVPSKSVSKGELTMQQARCTSVSRTLLGTPIYMSPEAHQGAVPDESFDLWSLTVVIIELLTGTHPFVRDSWGETHLSIIKGSASLPDWVRPELRELVKEKMLNADLDKRPRTAKELSDIFQNEWKVS